MPNRPTRPDPILPGAAGFDPARLGPFLLPGWWIACAAFLAVLLGGRLLNLHVDENFFLHQAFALRQGWAPPMDPARPYALYEAWLSLGLSEAPESLWTAVVVDSLAQLACMALLAWLAIRSSGPGARPVFWLVLTGILFYFTAGRLAEHRPDYLAVTLLYGGMLALLQGSLSGRRWAQVGGIALAGALLAMAACLSPRVVVMLGVSLPPLSLYLLVRTGPGATFRTAALGVAGAAAGAAAVWGVSGFSLIESLQTLVDAFTARDGASCCLSLETRLLDRKVPVALNLGILLAAVAALGLASGRRARLFAAAAASLALGQFALIVTDAQIFEYGYSYSLPAYLLLPAALAGCDSRTGPWPRRWLPTAAAAAFLGLFLAQVPLVLQSKGYVHERSLVLASPVDAASARKRLIRVAVRRQQLVPQLQAKILLCESLPDHRFVSKFQHNPICLRNGFPDIQGAYPIPLLPGRKNEFPMSKSQLAALREEFDLPADAVGLLFRPGPDGEALDVIPLR